MTLEQLQDQLQFADSERTKGNYSEAERLAKEVLTSINASSEGEGQEREWLLLHAAALRTLGGVSLRRSGFSQALEQFNISLALSEHVADKSGTAKSMHCVGLVYASLSDYPRALEYYSKALTAHEELGDKRSVAAVTGDIGIVYRSLSDYPRALEYYKKSLVAYEEFGMKSDTARITGNIGIVYRFLSDYPRALEYYSNALTIHEELGNKSSVALITGNIGAVYYSLSDYSRALEYYSKALVAHEELGEKSGAARVIGNIGIVYQDLTDYPRALEYYSKALAAREELGDKKSTANVIGNIGMVYYSLTDYPRALEYYSKALLVYEELGNKSGAAHFTGNIGAVHAECADYVSALEYYSKALAAHEELGEKSRAAFVAGNIGNLFAIKGYEGYNPEKAEEYLLKAIAMNKELGTKQNLYDNHKFLAQLYEHEERWKEHSYNFKKYHEIKEEVQSEEANKQAELMEHRRKIEESERDRQVKLARFREQEKIFHNILPVTIADRLIEGEKTIAESFDNVSIFFSDIVGFTTLSSQISATELVEGLNVLFTEFDRIATKHGLEKIKTIGDAYMAACGVPERNEDHALRTARFALDVCESIKTMAIGSQKAKVNIRIGLHCGNVVAGIIGEKKFAYDLWGDAVNTASRMESHGEAGKIHVSEDFKNMLGADFTFTPRGEMDIKGKGKMQTFFLEKE